MTFTLQWISRFVVVIACCAFAYGFVACGDEDGNDNDATGYAAFDNGAANDASDDATDVKDDASIFDSALDAKDWMIENGIEVRAQAVDIDSQHNDDLADNRAVCTSLWAQSPNAVNGRPSQDFEVAYDAYDAFGADDFQVPATKIWTIENIIIYGSDSSAGDPDNANDLTCYIFANDGSDNPDGLPNDTGVWDETFPASGGGYSQVGTRDLSFTPVTQPVLVEGTYWVSCWVREDFSNGQWFWEESSAADLSIAHWINPGNGFGVGATSWTDIQTALGSTSTGFAFDICGYEATTTTTTTITTTTTTTIPGDDDADDDTDDDVTDDDVTDDDASDDDASDDDASDDDNGGLDDDDDVGDDDGGGGDDDDDGGGCGC